MQKIVRISPFFLNIFLLLYIFRFDIRCEVVDTPNKNCNSPKASLDHFWLVSVVNVADDSSQAFTESRLQNGHRIMCWGGVVISGGQMLMFDGVTGGASAVDQHIPMAAGSHAR